MLPKGWSLKALEELATVERGKFSARPRNDPKFFGGNIPFVQTGDITSSKTYLSNYSQTLNEEGLKVSKEFSEGTILITIAANIGDTAITTFKVACPDSLVAIKTLPHIADTYWLKNVLETHKAELNAKAGQNAQKNINLQVLRPLRVLTPPHKEQQKIAQILSTWDQAIATTEKLLANSQQQKKALMQQLLTGKKRLPGFRREWSITTLGSHFDRVTTKNTQNNTNVVTISAQHGLIRQEEFFNKSVASSTLDGYFLLRKGQFAYNKSYSKGFPMGAIKRLNKYNFGVVTTLYICFQLKDETNANSDYFEQYFESGLLNKGLSQIAHEGGRAHGLLNVKPSDFFSLKFVLPPLKEQTAIANVLSTADKEIDTLKQKLAALKQEKQALMQQLLTGKRRVKVEEAA